ncbi:hypothetical protein C8R46DRAFT_1212918 [Mycena filopes]|nr:hypothetical protein C8R46DRAFT_1212918 [Mycena filopes]
MADWEYEFLCLVSGLSPENAGPEAFVAPDDMEETAIRMAGNVSTILGENYPMPTTKLVLEESLALSTTGGGETQLRCWLKDHLDRRPYNSENYFDIAIVIGCHDEGSGVSLRRVGGFDSEENRWKIVVQDSAPGQELIREETFYGPEQGQPIFCWERPYQYFEDWMRYSSPQVESWDANVFMEQFYHFVDQHRDPPWRPYIPHSRPPLRT